MDEGAGIEVEKGGNTGYYGSGNGSLKAVGGAYGAAGIGGKAGSTGYEGQIRTWDRNDYNRGWNYRS